jgi:hypothetical protein
MDPRLLLTFGICQDGRYINCVFLSDRWISIKIEVMKPPFRLLHALNCDMLSCTALFVILTFFLLSFPSHLRVPVNNFPIFFLFVVYVWIAAGAEPVLFV